MKSQPSLKNLTLKDGFGSIPKDHNDVCLMKFKFFNVGFALIRKMGVLLYYRPPCFLTVALYCCIIYFQNIQNVSKAHVDSFNYMLREGLSTAVKVIMRLYKCLIKSSEECRTFAKIILYLVTRDLLTAQSNDSDRFKDSCAYVRNKFAHLKHLCYACYALCLVEYRTC